MCVRVVVGYDCVGDGTETGARQQGAEVEGGGSVHSALNKSPARELCEEDSDSAWPWFTMASKSRFF